MIRPENVYNENPYLVLFDAAEKLGVFDFFEKKSQQEQKEFVLVDEIYKGCQYIPEEYKGRKCPNKDDCPFIKDKSTKRTPCKDIFNNNYPFILCPFKENSIQTFYFLMICLSSEMEFFEKKGRYFRKKYEGIARGSAEYEILASGIYNHIFDLKNLLNSSGSHRYFFCFKDRLIIGPHDEDNKRALLDELFFDKKDDFTYLKGMAKNAYDQLPEFLGVTDFSKCKTLLDIGPGPCVYAMGIFNKIHNLHRNKKAYDEDIKIFGLDSEAVESWYASEDYRMFVKDELKPLNFDEFMEKFTFVPIRPSARPGEYKKDGLFSDETWDQDLLKNKRFDVILIQNLLCCNSKRHVYRLLEKCYDRLNFGGQIIIQDYFKDISESEPFAAVVGALYFRSISNTGQTFTNFELSDTLFQCGFRNIKQLKVSTFLSIIEAEKSEPIAKDEILQRFWRHMFIINHKKNKQEDKGQAIDFEAIYTIEIFSLLKKAIIEYKKDILEIKLKEENPKRENYLNRFGERNHDVVNEDFFEEFIIDIKNIIDSCKDRIEKWLQKNHNGNDRNCELDADTIKDCWKLLFHLNILDKDIITEYPHDSMVREIKDKMYPENKQLIIKLLQSAICPDQLVIFFLLLIFKEFPDLDLEEITDVVTYISELDVPYSLARYCQKYCGPDPEACKFNLLHAIVRCDKINEPRSFIYLWALRWFLEYEFINREEFDFHLMIEEFSESKFHFIQKEVEKLGVLLGVKDERPHYPKTR
jgi:hypothetical protein